MSTSTQVDLFTAGVYELCRARTQDVYLLGTGFRGPFCRSCGHKLTKIKPKLRGFQGNVPQENYRRCYT